MTSPAALAARAALREAGQPLTMEDLTRSSSSGQPDGQGARADRGLAGRVWDLAGAGGPERGQEGRGRQAQGAEVDAGGQAAHDVAPRSGLPIPTRVAVRALV